MKLVEGCDRGMIIMTGLICDATSDIERVLETVVLSPAIDLGLRSLPRILRMQQQLPGAICRSCFGDACSASSTVQHENRTEWSDGMMVCHVSLAVESDYCGFKSSLASGNTPLFSTFPLLI